MIEFRSIARLCALAFMIGCVIGPLPAGAVGATGPGQHHHDRAVIMRMVADEALRQGLAPELALAVAHAESHFRPTAVSRAGARGVMQIMPRTARDLYGLGPEALFDPAINIRTGIHYLRRLIRTYGRKTIALSHYNGGSGVRSADGRLRVLPATRGYVRRVLSLEARYRGHAVIFAALAARRPGMAPGDLDDFGPNGSVTARLGRDPGRPADRADQVVSVGPAGGASPRMEALQRLADWNNCRGRPADPCPTSMSEPARSRVDSRRVVQSWERYDRPARYRNR